MALWSGFVCGYLLSQKSVECINGVSSRSEVVRKDDKWWNEKWEKSQNRGNRKESTEGCRRWKLEALL